MHFHLVHLQIPGGHGLIGYKEVIDSVHWGLTALGHEVTYAVNEALPNARNILFGGQMLGEREQRALPADTIVYNFEQLRGVSPDHVRRELRLMAGRFRLWDYSASNLDVWAQLKPKYPVVHVPVGYAPNLERIAPAATQDIDALIYGMPNEARLAAFNAVARRGLSAVFVCGLYGSARDELIARAKTVLNVTLYNKVRVFEIVRVSYLFANRKAVVAQVDPDTFAEDGVLGAVAKVDAETLVGTVADLCRDAAKRQALEQRGYDYFKTRDVRTILEKALGETG